MKPFDFAYWVLAFVNMVGVFANLQSQHYVVASVNFVVAFIMIYEIVSDSIQRKTDEEQE